MCDGVEQEEKTTVVGGVTWSLGVAAVLMTYLKSNVHGGLTHERIQCGEEYSPRWSLLELCRILLYKVGYSWTWFWIVCRQGRSCVLIGHLYPRPLIYSGARHTM